MADPLPLDRGIDTGPRHLRARFEQALGQQRPAPPPVPVSVPSAGPASGPGDVPVRSLPDPGGAGLLPVGFEVIAELRGLVAHQLAARTTQTGGLALEDREQLGWQLVLETVGQWGTTHATMVGPLSTAQEQMVAQAVFDDLFRAGRLQPLLNNAKVEDIRVQGNDQVEVVYQDRPRELLPPLVAADADLVQLVNQLSRTQGQGERVLSPASPTLNMRLADGSRLAAAYLVTPRPQVVIRKHRLRSTHLGDLVGWGTIDSVLAQFLAAAVRARKNLVVVGGQGAGKTSLLRAMAREISPGERIGTLESEFELWLHELAGGPQVVAFEAREGNGERDQAGRPVGQITLTDLFPQLLRMSLRRIIVGEVRSVEVVPMLHAMNEGEGGSMCTLHARSARSAIERLVTLCLESGIGMTAELAYRLIAQAVDLIVCIRQVDETEIGGRRHRFVEEVLEVTGVGEGGRPAVQRIFAPRGEGPGREPRAVPHQLPLCIEDLERAGFQRLDAEPGWHLGAPPEDGAAAVSPMLLGLVAALCAALAVVGLMAAIAALTAGTGPDRVRRRGRAERQLRALAGLDGGRGRTAWWRSRRTRVLSGVAVTAVVWALTAWPMAGLLSGLAAGNAAWLFNPGREHARRIARLEGLEEWVRRMSDIHTVGLSLEAAVINSVATVPDAITAPVKLLAGRLGAGWPPSRAYRAFADDLDDVTADMVVSLMLLHVQDRGSGLGKALKDLAASVADEVLMRRKVEADRAKPRANMRWITIFCLLVFGLSMFSGSYVGPYSTPGGQAAMVGFATGFVALLAWMRKMANLRPVPRFLSRSDRTLTAFEREHDKERTR